MLVKRMGIVQTIKDVFTGNNKKASSKVTPYEGSKLQQDVNKTPAKTVDAYQGSKLQKDVNKNTVAVKHGGGGGNAPKDASYTQGSSTYNPATRTLEEVNAPPQNKLTTAINQQNKLPSIGGASTMSAYQERGQIEQKPLYTLGGAAKQSYQNIVTDIGIAFGGKGEYRNPLKPFYYSSPNIRTENIKVIGGDYRVPMKQTISNAYYPSTVSYQREGTGAAIYKYGETAGVITGSFVAPEATSGYLMFTGIEKFSKGQNTEGLLRFGMGTVPYGIELKNIAKPMGDITKIRMEELSKSKVNILGTEPYATPTGSGFNIVARQQAYKAESTTLLQTGVKQTGENTFSIPTVRSGYTRTVVEDWATGKPITSLTKFTTAGRGTISEGVITKGGLAYSLPDVTKAYGTGIYTPTRTYTSFLGKTKATEGTTFTQFKFGGLTKTNEDFYTLAGGNIQKGKLYLGEKFGERTVSSDIKQAGFIQRFTQPETRNIFTSESGSRQLTNQVTKNIYPSGFTEQVSKLSTKQVSIPKTIVKSTGISTMSFPQTTQVSKQEIKQVSINAQPSQLKINTQTIQTSGLGSINKYSTITVPKVSDIQRSVPMLAQPTANIERQATKQTSVFATPSMNTPYVPNTFTTPTFPTFVPPVMPWFPNLDFSSTMTTKTYKGKQRKKYTPSFSALIFNIKGKMPKGMETGARVRPIPKNFKWSYNQPKFKFPRIKL